MNRAKCHAQQKDVGLKILIVTDAWYPQLNGVVRTYEYLRHELESMGYTVKIIGPSDFQWSVPMPGYPEIRLTLFPYNTLRHAISSFDPVVLHIATEGPLGLAARKYAREYGVEFTSCYHTHFPDYIAKRVGKYLPFLYKPVYKIAVWYVRFFHSISSCLFVATPSVEKTLLSWGFRIPIKRMTRGIDHSIFKLGEKTIFKDLKAPIALYVGRVAIEKNLESFLSMPWDGTKVIVGDGPDKAMLQKKYPHCVFAGTKTGQDLAACYQSSDVFVFPSRTDTFGMVIIEALACGLPVAAYPVTGPIDIITESFLGVLDDDLSTAAKACLLTTHDGGVRAKHAAEHYSWTKATHQFLETD